MIGWFRRRADEIMVRSVGPADRPLLTALLAGTWRRHGLLAVEEQIALLSSGASLMAFQGDEPVGFLGLAPRTTTGTAELWVDVALVAMAPDLAVGRVLGPLLAGIAPTWREQPITGLVCLTAQDWLIKALEAGGFREVDRVLSYTRPTRYPLAEPPRICELHEAKTGHAETILALNAAAFGPLWRYDERTLLSWLLLADHAVVAELEGRPVGFALTTLRLADGHAHLIRVATHPAHQGRGIGRQLVADAVRYAANAGAIGLSLNTQSSNAPARRLYEALGFWPTGDALSVMVRRF
jgi:ribosomal protein S18 acetylase RimI-like enzyme